jgi:4-diphosphocytidyl-2-C-methyl-D-erythritol kinase
MAEIHEIAYAKINLALHVRRRRGDGYHELETLFAFVDCGDVLTVRQSDTYQLKIIGNATDDIGPVDNNLITRAVQLCCHDVMPPIEIILNKQLPISAGLGGGSADAAATLRVLSQLGFAHDIGDMAQASAALGADVPACIDSLPKIGFGTGTELHAVNNDVSGMHCLLVNPGLPLSTPAVFKAWSGEDKGGLPRGSALAILDNGRNDLEEPAITLCPTILEVLEFLRNTNARNVRMSGSGATCFALYDDLEAANSAALAVHAVPERKHWWWMAGKLR